MTSNETPAAGTAPALTSDRDAPLAHGLPVLPPLTAFIELLALLVLPAVLDYVWPAFPTLSEMQPHLFWLPVLLLSLQYGTVSGLMTASVAIALSAFLGWPDQEIGENHFAYLLRIWTQPVLWLLAALILGQFRMRQIERKQELARHVAELAADREAIASYATNLRSRCETLEREIASRRAPDARRLLTALGRLQAGPDDAARVLSEAVSLAFGPCRLAAYKIDGQGLRLVARHGPDGTGEVTGDAALPLDGAMARAVAVGGQSLSVMVPGEERVLAGQALVAVPVLSAGGERIIGMLTLETAEAAELDADTARRLSVIAAIVAPLMQPGGIGGLTESASVSAKPLPRPRARLWRQLKWRPERAAPAAAPASSRTG